MVNYLPRKAKVIAELREIAPAWARGRAVKNAVPANSQILTGGGRILVVSRAEI